MLGHRGWMVVLWVKELLQSVESIRAHKAGS